MHIKSAIIAATFALQAGLANAYSPDADRLSVQKHFKSGAEPTAKDALWTTRGTFKVGVIDNGRNRDGYAEYVCSIVRKYGVKDQTRVEIIDILKLVRTNKWIKLGECICQ